VNPLLLTLVTALALTPTLVLLHQIQWMKKQLASRDQTIQSQMNLLLSKDPMTYATLQSQTQPHTILPFEEYIPTGTDLDEFTNIEQLRRGVRTEDDGTAADFDELGFV
jgi:hypothetical protein